MSRGAPSENFKQFLSFSDSQNRIYMRTHINSISQNRNKLTERKVIDVGNKRGRAYLLRRSRRRRGAPLPGVSLFAVFDVLDEKSRSVRGFARTFNLVRPRAITATTRRIISWSPQPTDPPGWSAATTLTREYAVAAGGALLGNWPARNRSFSAHIGWPLSTGPPPW